MADLSKISTSELIEELASRIKEDEDYTIEIFPKRRNSGGESK